MTAVERAVERGREAQSKKPKWEPVTVENLGWLIARVRNLHSDAVEGVFFGQGAWQFYAVGYSKDGEPRTQYVRAGDKELRKIAKAMLAQDDPEERGELLEECARNNKNGSAERARGGRKKRTRRKR